MAQKRNMPTQKQILKFWSNSDIFKEKGIEINETHPDCFACGNYIKIERAHIRAKFNGGEDTCDNLHLLCSGCHADSEYYEVDEYWDWLVYINANKFVGRIERSYEKSKVTPKYWLSALRLLRDNDKLMRKYANFVTKESIDSEIMRYEKIVTQSDAT
ncbi:MAG: HNH endonuclease signature motif containing protein [Pseudomonadales bacterium]